MAGVVLAALRPRLCGDCLTTAGNIALDLVRHDDDEATQGRLTDEDHERILSALRGRVCHQCAYLLDPFEPSELESFRPPCPCDYCVDPETEAALAWQGVVDRLVDDDQIEFLLFEGWSKVDVVVTILDDIVVSFLTSNLCRLEGSLK